MRSLRLLRTLFNRQWWWITLLVMVGVAVLARLGVWQLDRLEQRRAQNAVLAAQLEEPPLSLNELPADGVAWPALVDRQAVVTGTFDLENQVLLRLQSFAGRPGSHLLTPLLLPGREAALLVDRGWIPEEDQDPARWGQYDRPGEQMVSGYLQAGQRPPPSAERPAGPQLEWFRVDLAAIEAQLPYDLLPVYLLESPAAGGDSTPPLRSEPEFDLSEGPHLGYALQWFAFALMLASGYIYYVYRNETKFATDRGGRA